MVAAELSHPERGDSEACYKSLTRLDRLAVGVEGGDDEEGLPAARVEVSFVAKCHVDAGLLSTSCRAVEGREEEGLRGIRSEVEG